jgi:hypothetical protein
MKSYTINHLGEVCECSKFTVCIPTVKASTKTEATRLLLLACKHMVENQPTLHVRNGAYCLVTATDYGFNADTGSLSRAGESGRVFPLCSSSHATLQKALSESSFAYYASEEFQASEKASV